MTIYDLKTMQMCDIRCKTVVALGLFDGCHLGHVSVLQNAFYKAKELGVKSLAYTFDSVSVKGQDAVMTLEERIKAIRKTGIDYLAVDKLSDVMEMSGDEFVYEILMNKLGAICATCGYNYRFGKGAGWSAEDLTAFFKKVGGSVQISPNVTYKNEPISSTLVRGKIKNGEVEELLSYMMPYSIYSVVESGKGLGKEMGIATINQQIPKGKIVPKTGVYITECEIGEDVYPSVTNVGYRPTTDGENDYLNVETHIIGYFGNLYHSCLRVNFYKYLREEKKFASINELIQQIESDKKSAQEYFK